MDGQKIRRPVSLVTDILSNRWADYQNCLLQVVKEYEDRKKYIAQLTRDLQDKETRLFNHQSNIEEV